uniref:Uncharacterized protein n=1 Tax=Anguilla anguilla TaxID=7936 RepID=A0A0E9X3B0_ANGAN
MHLLMYNAHYNMHIIQYNVHALQTVWTLPKTQSMFAHWTAFPCFLKDSILVSMVTGLITLSSVHF